MSFKKGPFKTELSLEHQCLTIALRTSQPQSSSSFFVLTLFMQHDSKLGMHAKLGKVKCY